MSMGMVLEGVRDYLRDQNTWNRAQCGIQFGAVPAIIAGDFFVGLDDDGVTTTDERNYHLTEEYQIEIAIWRRTGRTPPDYRGQIQLPDDIYIETAQSLTKLERLVVQKLHKLAAVPVAINTQFALPSEALGSEFILPLTYLGRSKNEVISLETAQGVQTFAGRRLRFRGLKRVQYVDSIG